MTETKVVLPSGGENFVALPAGTRVGRYTVTGVLGQGTFGVTYAAHDGQLDRTVAIKEYLPTSFAVRHEGHSVRPSSTETADDFAWGLQRFVEEGRTLASFQHAPGIVRVYDFLEANGTAYMVMELVQGDTLGTRLRRRGPLSAAEAERILRPLLDGLEKIHAASFVHRDIKPDNILLDADGVPTLIDFGAARAAIAGRTAAMTGIFTPGYAAIEQFTDARQGAWTDIYGLSATLYHAIAGTKAPSAVDRALNDGLVPLARLKPKGFPRPMLAGIDRGLSLRPEARPQSIAAWRTLLFPTAARAAVARWQVPALAGAAAALVLLTGAAWFAFDLAGDTRIARQEETQRRAAAEQQQRRQADAAAHRQAEAELAQRQAEADARQRAAAQEALRRAEAEAASRAQAEDEARRRADAERRDAERQLAEQAERDRLAAQKTMADEAARKAQEDAARAKVEAERDGAARLQAAEAAEAALRLGPADRQRLQVALTAQGFDTRGSDGVLGPRSREMVAAWQASRGLVATGFLDGAQQQRVLRESAAAVARFDDEQKKSAEEEARRRERAHPDATATPTSTTTALRRDQSAATVPAASFDGTWSFVRSKCIPVTPQRFPSVTVSGNRFTYSFMNANLEAGCTAEIRPDGSFANSACRAPVTGRIAGNRMTMSQKHPEVFCDFEFQRP
jgi:peptidoglycan hydrolase-like protein with peptidoglycan-binding domain